MKQVVFLFIFFFAAIFTCIAQDYQEVVYLKNGSVVRGFVIEIIPDEYLDIRTTNGRIRSIEMYDVERIVKERVRTESRIQSAPQNNTRSSQNDYGYSPNNNRAPQNNARSSQNDYGYPSNNRASQNNARSSQNDYGYPSNNRAPQNNARSSQNDYGYPSNNNRYAQNYYDDSYYVPQNSVHFGVKTGLNLADTRETDTNFKAGIHGGIFGEFKFNNFALQPELLFSMQGAKAKDEEITAKLNLNYSIFH